MIVFVMEAVVINGANVCCSLITIAAVTAVGIVLLPIVCRNSYMNYYEVVNMFIICVLILNFNILTIETFLRDILVLTPFSVAMQKSLLGTQCQLDGNGFCFFDDGIVYLSTSILF